MKCVQLKFGDSVKDWPIVATPCASTRFHQGGLCPANVQPLMVEEKAHDYGTPISWKGELELYLFDDWILPVRVMRKPALVHPQDKFWVGVAKNFLLVTLMSLTAGYEPVIQRYQESSDCMALQPPSFNSVVLSKGKLRSVFIRNANKGR